MKTHPEIPPNDNFIYPQADGDIWIGGMFFDPEGATHRQIIAAVCRCAWIDERVRIFNELPMKNNAEVKVVFDEMYTANEHAERWAKWGRGEEF